MKKLFNLNRRPKSALPLFRPGHAVPKATTIETEDLRLTLLARYLKAGDIGSYRQTRGVAEWRKPDRGADLFVALNTSRRRASAWLLS